MGTAAEELVHLATIMAQAAVNHPDAVRVQSTVGTQVVMLDLHVHPDDLGQVIGKDGVYADAMRRLLTAAAGKLRVRAILEVIDSKTSSRPSSSYGDRNGRDQRDRYRGRGRGRGDRNHH